MLRRLSEDIALEYTLDPGRNHASQLPETKCQTWIWGQCSDKPGDVSELDGVKAQQPQ